MACHRPPAAHADDDHDVAVLCAGLQMSKKIAQLTKVIYALNSKNDDQEMQLTAVQDAYEAEIETMLKETYTRINEFRKQLDFQKQQTDFEGKLRRATQAVLHKLGLPP